MSCAFHKSLIQRPVKAAVLIAALCCIAHSSLAEQPFPPYGASGLALAANATGFALQVSLRNGHAPAKPLETDGAETPLLDYRLTTSLEHDSLELGSTALSIADQFGSLRLKAAPKETPLPHLLSWMEGWRMDIERGLFRPLRDHAWRMAIAYTDIFDTRGNPDKGSHGLGVLFRYDFRRPSVR
jgi:hypothetical protein